MGSHNGVTAFGALDMAGNVREWCWNPTEGGRLNRGGAWDDAEYMQTNLTQQPLWSRAPQNGVRCVVDPEPALVPTAFFDMTGLVSGRHFREAVPVNDAVFASYKSRFDYDPSDLGARVEERDESAEDWIREKVTFNAAYEGKRVTAHLLLPRSEHLYPQLWPAWCEDFQLGRWVYFGCLAVQKQTLRLERRNLSWEDVSRVWVDKGHLVIDLKDQSHYAVQLFGYLTWNYSYA